MIIRLQNVFYKVPNGNTIYESLNLHVYRGDFVGVLGRNGAGKTTLIDFLMGYRPITEGEISVFGEDPMDPNRSHKNDIFVLSHDIKIQQNYSVRNYLDFMSYFYPQYQKSMEARLLDYLGIDPSVKFGSLSTGQKAKAQIIAALSSGASLIIVDEITAVLDPESRAKFFILLKQIKETGNTTLIMATNIAEDLDQIADKVLFIDSTKASMHKVEEIKDLFDLEIVEDAA